MHRLAMGTALVGAALMIAATPSALATASSTSSLRPASQNPSSDISGPLQAARAAAAAKGLTLLGPWSSVEEAAAAGAGEFTAVDHLASRFSEWQNTDGASWGYGTSSIDRSSQVLTVYGTQEPPASFSALMDFADVRGATIRFVRCAFTNVQLVGDLDRMAAIKLPAALALVGSGIESDASGVVVAPKDGSLTAQQRAELLTRLGSSVPVRIGSPSDVGLGNADPTEVQFLIGRSQDIQPFYGLQ